MELTIEALECRVDWELCCVVKSRSLEFWKIKNYENKIKITNSSDTPKTHPVSPKIHAGKLTALQCLCIKIENLL